MKAIITLFAICMSVTTYAQLGITSTTFWNNYAHVNPAMSALEYKKHGSFSYRNEATNTISSHPSILANYNFLLGEKHGIGINYSYENFMSSQEQLFNLNYNYQIKFAEGKRVLSIGSGLGVYASKIDPNSIVGIETLDSSIVIQDKLKALNLNAGAAYTSGNFMFGIGVDNLLEDALSNRKDEELSFYSNRRGLYMNGHYKINLGKKKNLEIRPQFIYRTDFSFSSFDLNLLATYKDKYWAGFTYRNRDSFAFMMGWDIKKKFRVGYSVDIFPASLTNGSIRSHEFNLGFFLK